MASGAHNGLVYSIEVAHPMSGDLDVGEYLDFVGNLIEDAVINMVSTMYNRILTEQGRPENVLLVDSVAQLGFTEYYRLIADVTERLQSELDELTADELYLFGGWENVVIA